MRMHSYGKCTPNVIVGALLIFSIILLYNFWNVSTVNHDLGLKIHSLEQQLIALSKNNDALQSNLEKIHGEKGKLQMTIQKDDTSIKSLQADLDSGKKTSQRYLDEINSLSTKIQSTEKELTECKSKVVSLQAQTAEKANVNERLEKELKNTKESLEKEIAKLKLTSPKPLMGKPGIDVAHEDAQPVLINDPAVPYPNGWMDPGFSGMLHNRPIHINVSRIGNDGIIPHNSPVIIMDDPSLPKAKARFSVVDPPKHDLFIRKPENEMNKPDLGAPGVPSPPLKQPNGEHKLGENQQGGEVMQEGVLPPPGQQPQLLPQGNLDAQEDDGDRPMKEDLAQQDDQSPDGALSQKEKDLAVAPQPVIKPPDTGVRAGGLPGHSGQDNREAAHNPVGENPQDLNLNSV